jgi:hypothetical protein
LRDAFFVAEHFASRNGNELAFDRSSDDKADQAEFIMLKDGGILFEGNASELREAAKHEAYIRAFLS